MQTQVFKNGFTVVYEKSPQKTPITVVYAYIKVGSIHENETNRGSSHFVEHMCFKGTKQINTSKELFKSFDEIGAVFNANTEKDYTRFYFKCSDEYNEHCLSILSDMILNSVFKKKEYYTEMPILMEEMIRNQDNPDTQFINDKDRFIYRGSPYSEPVDDIVYHKHSEHPYIYENTLEYYQTYYQPQNIVLSIVSNQSFKKIIQILSKTFFTNKKKTINICKIIQPIAQTNSNTETTEAITYHLLEKKGLESHHIFIGFRVCEHGNNDRYVLNLLSQIVGGSMSSRMSILLREQNGLTYTSDCSTDYFKICGEFTIYAVTDPKKLMVNGKKIGVFPLLISLIKNILKQNITQEELNIAKGNFKGQMLIQQEDITNTAEYNALHHAVYPDEPFIPYTDIFEKCYEKITLKQIKAIIPKYLKYSNMYVSIMGEKDSYYPTLEKLKKVCRNLDK